MLNQCLEIKARFAEVCSCSCCRRHHTNFDRLYRVDEKSIFYLFSFRGGGGSQGGDHFRNIHRTYVTCETERLKDVA